MLFCTKIVFFLLYGDIYFYTIKHKKDCILFILYKYLIMSILFIATPFGLDYFTKTYQNNLFDKKIIFTFAPALDENVGLQELW